MKKLTLYLILGFKEQTEKYVELNNRYSDLEAKGKKVQVSTMSQHINILSKNFDLKNFFDYYEDLISQTDDECQDKLIYHIPYGLEDRNTGVEEKLDTLKGKLTIFSRVYDPHSPNKLSVDYHNRYHDYTFTWLKEHCKNNHRRMIYTPMAYDNHLFYDEYVEEKRNKNACMILGNKINKSGYDIFEHKTQDVINIYSLRDDVANVSEVDIFGLGWDKNLTNYRGAVFPHEIKYKISEKYKLAFVLENCIADAFISEKILDSFLTFTVPIYKGCNDISNYIPENCYISFDDIKETSISSFVSEFSVIDYNKYRKNIEENRDAIFSKFTTEDNYSKVIYSLMSSKYGRDYEIELIGSFYNGRYLVSTDTSKDKLKRIVRRFLKK